MLIPEDVVTVHTKYNVIMTSYPWPTGGVRPHWTRRFPAWQNGLVDRGKQPYGQQVANLCNTYRVSCLSGFHTAKSPVFANFHNSLWSSATNTGALKLLHMFDVNQDFPAEAAGIVSTVVGWGTKYMKNSKYARIRLPNGESRPLLLFWATHAGVYSQKFRETITAIRNGLAPIVGPVFIVGTEHIANAAIGGNSDAVAALQAVDGFYHHQGGLPGQPGVQWNGVQSLQQLENALQSLSALSVRYKRPFFAGTMPRFDRDLFSLWREQRLDPQGRVVIENAAQLTNLLQAARRYAPLMYSETKMIDGAEHEYEERWVVLTSLNEWEEGQTFEPCLVRNQKYDPATNYEYGTDAMQAVADVFRDRITRRVGRTPVPR
jgi:hypothetical protein